MYCQYLEYTGARFSFSDSIFGSTFYLTTGFHGGHVLIGGIYLAVALATLSTAKPGQSVCLDLAILYWHFVDIVWVFLLRLVYVWGSRTPTTELSACTDSRQTMQLVLHDARAFACAHDKSLFEG
jgi:heme/copper-type cytochrome/quinol oxidase subunit 3